MDKNQKKKVIVVSAIFGVVILVLCAILGSLFVLKGTVKKKLDEMAASVGTESESSEKLDTSIESVADSDAVSEETVVEETEVEMTEELKQQIYQEYLQILNDKYYGFLCLEDITSTLEYAYEAYGEFPFSDHTVMIGDVNGDNVDDLVISTYVPEGDDSTNKEAYEACIREFEITEEPTFDSTVTEIYTYVDGSVKQIFSHENVSPLGQDDDVSSLLYYYENGKVIASFSDDTTPVVFRYNEETKQYEEVSETFSTKEEIENSFVDPVTEENSGYLSSGYYSYEDPEGMISMSYEGAIEYLVNENSCDDTELTNVVEYKEKDREVSDLVRFLWAVRNMDEEYSMIDFESGTVYFIDTNQDGIDEILMTFTPKVPEDSNLADWEISNIEMSTVYFVFDLQEGGYQCVQKDVVEWGSILEGDGQKEFWIKNNLIAISTNLGVGAGAMHNTHYYAVIDHQFVPAGHNDSVGIVLIEII